jgi:hypothetical protein
LDKLRGSSDEVGEVITLAQGPLLTPEVYFELRREEDSMGNSFLIIVLNKCIRKVTK